LLLSNGDKSFQDRDLSLTRELETIKPELETDKNKSETETDNSKEEVRYRVEKKALLDLCFCSQK